MPPSGLRVLVAGATGFIGSHIARAAQAAGHEVVGAVRNPELGIETNPEFAYVGCDFTRDTAEDWRERLEGVDVVVNAVGIITESGAGRFREVHVRGTKALFDACKRAGVRRIIHISALGVCEDSTTAYNLTKKEADDYLLTLGVPAVVLRPSWLYGRGSHSFEVLNAFSALPFIPVTGSGAYRVQPLFVGDFAAAVTALLDSPALDGQLVELGGKEQMSIAELHRRLRAWQGRRPAPVLAVPEPVVRIAATLGDHLFKGPINTASMDMLTRHNVTADARFWQAAGCRPRLLSQVLAEHPSTSAERSHAALFFLLPLLRYSLALLWIASALVPLLSPLHQLQALMTEAGVSAEAARYLVPATLILDFLLGLTLLFNYRLGVFGWAQVSVIAAYSLFLAVQAPHWWLHPYGPLIKNIPLVAATLVVTAIPRRR